ncbi:hypothetical protein CcaverHIS002_0108790 [Cutaneotrichosporon cavernicola]|uniref:Acyl-CoA dehydrogenase n=1 Tax=Cutaneotrichosporon cavernicola TaxID=279322 RepID=A0AA48I6U8_9TREE|nr:uncharacterized protein CcaverHIS019_0108730 [Cutaneotrichosporon cavernicola]BEI80350.1 hypothetical protein CcaverHIS002_0108790 [Cutaneotrichosporon cavernicola]BEI88155.1 hypothetical protein CcaverHIS019_0108730 [Cutaneotrichosporon cavernicola]BEI95925.1 hypothetical protein CcaverHIS631_0108740 [Cutaneotrichosporon cavernicola]BEJ03700.1 hypothetical protein CcaverHIS641_0108750 [Cutaneotrichosporon cavernicola]
MSPITPGSSTSGFFQTPPKIANQFREDQALNRSMAMFLAPETRARIAPDLDRLGDLVLTDRIHNYINDAESNSPKLRGNGYTMWGASQDANTLVTAAGWKELLRTAREESIVNTAYDAELGPDARVVQAAKINLWCASSAMTACPSGMQDGGASIVINDLARPASDRYPEDVKPFRKMALEKALERLLSRDPEWGWTSGQWMTERRGGSDVKGTETVATWVGMGDGVETDLNGVPLGPYSISGFKWFASATDCGCSILLAYTDAGLSCFYAPTRRLRDGKEVMNGLRIMRVKQKLGTHALPSSEIELKDMRGWLIGDEGRGVAVIAKLLNITRFHNAARSNGYLGRGLGAARAFARLRTFPSRQAPNNVLKQIPLFCHSLSKVTIRHRADTFFTMFLAALLGADVTKTYTAPVIPKGEDAELLLRLLTSVAKAYNTKHCVIGLQECMESLGGVGYIENNETPQFNIARLFRDSNVMPIWEGTTDVLSTDTVKVLRGKVGPGCTAALDRWLRANLSGSGFKVERDAIQAAWNEALAWPTDKEELLHEAREVVETIGNIVCSMLLVIDAERDGNDVAAEIARRFTRQSFGLKPPRANWEETHRMDQRIAFEADADSGRLERARL